MQLQKYASTFSWTKSANQPVFWVRVQHLSKDVLAGAPKKPVQKLFALSELDEMNKRNLLYGSLVLPHKSLGILVLRQLL